MVLPQCGTTRRSYIQDNHLLRRPAADAPRQLAARLKWLLQQASAAGLPGPLGTPLVLLWYRCPAALCLAPKGSARHTNVWHLK